MVDVISVVKHPTYNIICMSNGDLIYLDEQGNPCNRKQSIGATGYKQILIGNRTTGRKTVRVHRIIAEAFLPNTENLPCVDHINRDKGDNSLSNLRWASYETNNNNSIRQLTAATDTQHRKHAKSCKEYYKRKVMAGFKKVNIKVGEKPIQRWIKE